MKRLYFIGYKGKSIISRLIRWRTLGEYSHVEWLVDVETLKGYGSWEKGGGVNYFTPDMHRNKTPYTVWYVNVTKLQYSAFETFMLSQKGKKYDWRGIFGFFSNKDTNNPLKWFCSEILAFGARLAKIRLFNWDDTVPGLLSPSKFGSSGMLNVLREGLTKK